MRAKASVALLSIDVPKLHEETEESHTLKSSQLVHGGTVNFYTHKSHVNACEMSFAVFLPPSYSKSAAKNPWLLFLSGLTCTEENFVTKSAAFKKAAELGVALLIPDTSPRGDDVADDDAYDLGQGAGFYIDATQPPWSTHFNMESYIMRELIPLTERHFGLTQNHLGISGHSMGGHGALTLYYKYPHAFVSCSALAPIVAPSRVPWGEKAFKAYLGEHNNNWQKHDACELVKHANETTYSQEILIDQGLNDSFLTEQLKPELFEKACHEVGQKLQLRMHEGYDHSYYFIQTFIDEHLNFHHKKLT